MRISLRSFNHIESNTFMIEQTLSLDELCSEVSHLVELKPVQVKVQATKIRENLYHVNGKQKTEAFLTCSRCLKPFPMPLNSEWETQFTEEVGMAHEVDGEEVHLLETEQLDLTPFVRESLLLAIPYAPICQEDCKGLCPVCGADHNQTSCDCKRETIDPRWAKLQELTEED